jgi:predicted DNA-binding transcriptional regulator AlpA
MRTFSDDSNTFEVFDDNDFYYDAQTGKKLISLKQTSEIYSIPLQTVYKMSSRGKLPKFKIGKRI